MGDNRPKKKKNKIKKSAFDIDRKNIVESAGRRTRGVKIDYSLIEGSDDSDAPKEKPEEGPKGKGKGPREFKESDEEFKVENSDDEKVEEEEEEGSSASEASEDDIPLGKRKD